MSGCFSGIEAEFLEEIQTKVFLAIRSQFYSFALRFLFLQTHATSYSFYSSVSVDSKRWRKTWEKTIPPSLWFKKSIQKPHVWQLQRLCPETSTKLYVHEFGFRARSTSLDLFQITYFMWDELFHWIKSRGFMWSHGLIWPMKRGILQSFDLIEPMRRGIIQDLIQPMRSAVTWHNWINEKRVHTATDLIQPITRGIMSQDIVHPIYLLAHNEILPLRRIPSAKKLRNYVFLFDQWQEECLLQPMKTVIILLHDLPYPMRRRFMLSYGLCNRPTEEPWYKMTKSNT